MLKPISMKKFSAVILDEKKDGVLRELKEGGIVQLIEHSNIEEFKDLELAAVPSSWIRAKASEYLARVDNILETFKLVEPGKGSSVLENFLEEEVEKVPVIDAPPQLLFEEVENKLRITSERVAQISSRLEVIKKEKEELNNSKATLSILEKLNAGPGDLKEHRLTRTPVGVIPSKELENLKKDVGGITKDCLLYSSKLDKQNSVVSLIFFKEYEAEIAKILRIHRFEEVQILPRLRDYGLEEAFSKIESELASIAKEEKELLKETGEIAAKEKNKLLQIRELLKVEEFLDAASTLFGKTAKTYVLSGWVPSNQVDEVVNTVRKSSDNYCAISVEDPKKEDKPPTLLSNPRQIESVELLTNTYGSPKYEEIDPTTVMSLTFPLVFGLMFGDVGQGVLIILLGYFLKFRLRATDALKNLGGILILCGIAATLVGFLYGSVFGLEGEHLKHYLGFELHPLLFNPMHDIMSSIVFALKLGIVLLILACTLNIVNEIMHRKYVHAIVGPYGLAGIWLLLGGASLVYKHGVDVYGIVGDASLIPKIVLPVFVMFMGAWRDAGLSIGMALLEAYENATRYLLNSLSFIRIAIMSVVHVALSMMMVMFMGMMPATLLGLILTAGIFVGGNLAILLIETLVSFIQTLRLHYYECFSKFYSGQGKRFEPFKVIRKHTYIEKV